MFATNKAPKDDRSSSQPSLSSASTMASMSVEDMFSNDKFPSVESRFPGLSVLEMSQVVDEVYRQPPDLDLQLVDANGMWRFKRHPLNDRGLVTLVISLVVVELVVELVVGEVAS